MKSLDWRVREAVTKDFQGIKGNPMSLPMRAWVLEVGGKLVGLGGVFLKKRAWTAFVRVVDGQDVPKSILVKAMKIGFDRILSMKLPTLCAIKEKELCTADNLLNHFGFVQAAVIGEEEIYIWQKQQ